MYLYIYLESQYSSVSSNYWLIFTNISETLQGAGTHRAGPGLASFYLALSAKIASKSQIHGVDVVTVNSRDALFRLSLTYRISSNGLQRLCPMTIMCLLTRLAIIPNIRLSVPHQGQRKRFPSNSDQILRSKTKTVSRVFRS